jgi:hypothetical protein
MRRQKGQRWKCESRYCGSEFQVVASSGVECGINPRCFCGSIMERITIAPQMKPSQAAAMRMEERKAAGSTSARKLSAVSESIMSHWLDVDALATQRVVVMLLVRGSLTSFRWWVALQAESCFYQSNDYGEDYGGCDAEHEHSISRFNGFQQSPPGR